MFPVEIGTWGADPVKFRRQYGKNLLMMGGFDKHLLQAGKRQIEAEIRRLAPLVESGGFIPMPDHRVPPDVTLESYLFYCDKAREIWGRGVAFPPINRVPSASMCSV
jgi:uroporphyrinogen decarboxylase